MILEVQILIGVLITSIISGIIGMGGGVILMAIYSSLLPVKLAMILHGITQLSSNGSRAIIHKKNIKIKILIPYLLGTLIMFTILRSFKFVPSKAMIYILLGFFPLLGFLPKLSNFFSITRKHRPLACGLAVTAAQISSGASGGVLDIFYINSPLNRFQIIATKAFTQSIGHLVKLIYYLSLFSIADDGLIIHWITYPLVVLTATTGSYLGKFILNHLNENWFRSISKFVILLISLGLLYKAYLLLK